jgi:hypothetical protein
MSLNAQRTMKTNLYLVIERWRIYSQDDLQVAHDQERHYPYFHKTHCYRLTKPETDLV